MRQMKTIISNLRSSISICILAHPCWKAFHGSILSVGSYPRSISIRLRRFQSSLPWLNYAGRTLTQTCRGFSHIHTLATWLIPTNPLPNCVASAKLSLIAPGHRNLLFFAWSSSTKLGVLRAFVHRWKLEVPCHFWVKWHPEAPCPVHHSSPAAPGPVPSTWKLLCKTKLADWFFQWPSLMCCDSISKWAGNQVSELETWST